MASIIGVLLSLHFNTFSKVSYNLLSLRYQNHINPPFWPTMSNLYRTAHPYPCALISLLSDWALAGLRCFVSVQLFPVDSTFCSPRRPWAAWCHMVLGPAASEVVWTHWRSRSYEVSLIMSLNLMWERQIMHYTVEKTSHCCKER